MSLHLPNGRPIHLGAVPLGRGAQGIVCSVEGTADLCAKIYMDPSADITDRLRALIRHPAANLGGDHPEHLHAAWPVELLLDDDGQTRGFLMPRVTGKRISSLFDQTSRSAALDQPTWRVMLAVAARTARLLDRLHSMGVVIGDVSPSNLMVDRAGLVTLTDCDEVQFTDQATRDRYPSSYVRFEYVAPEFGPYSDSWRPPEHDLFGLAILVCQLLMEGEHPFEGVPNDDDTEHITILGNIRSGNNRITRPESLIASSERMPITVLPPQVRALAETSFGPGIRNPQTRPSALAWSRALDQAGFELMGCRSSEWHVYHKSLTACVWCDRLASGRGDHYPALDPTPARQ